MNPRAPSAVEVEGRPARAPACPLEAPADVGPGIGRPRLGGDSEALGRLSQWFFAEQRAAARAEADPCQAAAIEAEIQDLEPWMTKMLEGLPALSPPGCAGQSLGPAPTLFFETGPTAAGLSAMVKRVELAACKGLREAQTEYEKRRDAALIPEGARDLGEAAPGRFRRTIDMAQAVANAAQGQGVAAFVRYQETVFLAHPGDSPDAVMARAKDRAASGSPEEALWRARYDALFDLSVAAETCSAGIASVQKWARAKSGADFHRVSEAMRAGRPSENPYCTAVRTLHHVGAAQAWLVARFANNALGAEARDHELAHLADEACHWAAQYGTAGSRVIWPEAVRRFEDRAA